jgi:hypothetical protein
MNITINADLSSKIISEDGKKQCGLPSYNPETLAPFSSEAEVTAYARSIYGNPRFFHDIPTTTYRTTMSPVEFKMLLTAQERVAIKELAKTDPIIEDFLEILNDPRLKDVILTLQANIDAMGYLTLLGVLTTERAEVILRGMEV